MPVALPGEFAMTPASLLPHARWWNTNQHPSNFSQPPHPIRFGRISPAYSTTFALQRYKSLVAFVGNVLRSAPTRQPTRLAYRTGAQGQLGSRARADCSALTDPPSDASERRQTVTLCASL